MLHALLNLREKMGINCSKQSSSRPRESSFLPPNQSRKYDDKVVNRLRDDLNDDPEMFILNNLLMSIQFYENFDREMEILRKNQVSEREIELNEQLRKTNYRKHCLLPDTVMGSINQRVRFRPFHGPKKYESEPLLPQRMFIIHDNIEALYEGETSEYSTVDGPIHRAFVERAEKHQGYVQLKEVEFLDVQGKTDSDKENEEEMETSQKSSTISFNLNQTSPPLTPTKQRLFAKNTPSSPSPLKETQFTFTENIQSEVRRSSETKGSILKNKLLRTQSITLPKVSETPNNKITKEPEQIEQVQEDDDKEYGYTTLRRLTAPKPLNEARANRSIVDASSLSPQCITEIKTKKIMYDDEDDSDSDDSLMEDGRRRPPKKKVINDFYEIKKYFNSKEFFAHFGDVFETIYESLGITESSFRSAMVEGGRIHLNTVDNKGNKAYYEIIPSIATSWPIVAYEWNLRRRNAIQDPNSHIIYKWPTDRMSAKIKGLQSMVLPVGFIQKRGINENNPLEWSLSFPAAERYMETCMSHTQVRCYLFILAFYKTFMEPQNTKLGLVPHHILTLMFWEIEKNFVTWPEDRLGLKMIKIMKLLYEQLARGYLPDYFVRERNLLESSPSKYLRVSQSRLHDIIERPVVHALLALRNLRYTSGTFFPTLNFKNLYRIITTNDSLALVNPLLATFVENNREEEKMEELNEFKENAISFWNKMHKSEDRERKWKRELRKQMELEKKEQQKAQENLRRVSVDSVNLEINVNATKLDVNKRRVLLEFFINHFIKVAQKCFEYEAYKYALVILEHSHSLAILLSEEPSGELEARPLKKTIMENIEKCHWELKQKIPRVATKIRENRQIKFDLSNLPNENINNNININNQEIDEPVVLRKKNKPENLEITVDVHQPNEVITPVRSTPNSVILEETEDIFETSDL